MEIIRVVQNNDGSECEGFGLCRNGERWIARFDAVVRTSFHGPDIPAKICENHLARYAAQCANIRVEENRT